MKKLTLFSLLVFVVVMSSGLVEASSNFQLQKLKYEPYPANPGEYFDLWLKVENIGDEIASNASFELALEYPFSLHPDSSAVQSYGAIGTDEEDIIVLEYKIKVDEDAVEGVYELRLETCPESVRACIVYDFDVTVENVQTDFDVVVQETSTEAISLAIANTGKNPANSVTVKIPEQESFRIVGVSDSIVGNIDSGDYTIVSFEIQSKSIDVSERGRVPVEAELKVQIDYTDIINERRTVIKNVPLSLQSALPEGGGINGNGEFKRPGQSGGLTLNNSTSNLWFWVSVILSLVMLVLIYRTVKTRKKIK